MARVRYRIGVRRIIRAPLRWDLTCKLHPLGGLGPGQSHEVSYKQPSISNHDSSYEWPVPLLGSRNPIRSTEYVHACRLCRKQPLPSNEFTTVILTRCHCDPRYPLTSTHCTTRGSGVRTGRACKTRIKLVGTAAEASKPPALDVAVLAASTEHEESAYILAPTYDRRATVIAARYRRQKPPRKRKRDGLPPCRTPSPFRRRRRSPRIRMRAGKRTSLSRPSYASSLLPSPLQLGSTRGRASFALSAGRTGPS